MISFKVTFCEMIHLGLISKSLIVCEQMEEHVIKVDKACRYDIGIEPIKPFSLITSVT